MWGSIVLAERHLRKFVLQIVHNFSAVCTANSEIPQQMPDFSN